MAANPNPADDVINFNDFKSMKLDIAVENQTTHTTVYANRRIYPKGKDELIEEGSFPIIMQQLLEKGFVLDLPARTCSVGHVIKVLIETQNLAQNKKYTFICKAKVLLEGDRNSDPSKARQQFEVELQNVDPEQWRSFQAIFESRQNEILDFFDAVKG